ncbi:hypothetical protein QFZ97_001141 [Paraburkholderia youngii]
MSKIPRSSAPRSISSGNNGAQNVGGDSSGVPEDRVSRATSTESSLIGELPPFHSSPTLRVTVGLRWHRRWYPSRRTYFVLLVSTARFCATNALIQAMIRPAAFSRKIILPAQRTAMEMPIMQEANTGLGEAGSLAATQPLPHLTIPLLYQGSEIWFSAYRVDSGFCAFALPCAVLRDRLGIHHVPSLQWRHAFELDRHNIVAAAAGKFPSHGGRRVRLSAADFAPRPIDTSAARSSIRTYTSPKPTRYPASSLP